MNTYFYDNQIRRYLLQFMRIFADLQIEIRPGLMRRVPVKYGSMNRMVAHILRDNTPNTVLSAPQMGATITAIEMDNNRRRDTMYVSKKRAVERQFDSNTGQYTGEPGNRYSIETMMPVPYLLKLRLDVWTTNTTDKFQILEQIMTVFNPSVQIQTTSNPLDWTSIFEVELTNITWSSTSVPQGTDTSNDIASLDFSVPVWITPPARITKQRVVESIITNVFSAGVTRGQVRDVLDPLSSCFEGIKQFIITPNDLEIDVAVGNSTNQALITLANQQPWSTVFGLYGNVEATGGLLTLKTHSDIESTQGDIVGTLTAIDDHVLELLIHQDTIPPPNFFVNAVVDPQKQIPGQNLPEAAAGQRYLIISQPTGNVVPEIAEWTGVAAQTNDVIEFVDEQWQVVFNSATETNTQWLLNTSTNEHFVFDSGEWSFTWLGRYRPGYWKIEA